MAEGRTPVGVWHSACRVAQVVRSRVTVQGQNPQTGGAGSWNLPNIPCLSHFSKELSLLSSFNLSSFPFFDSRLNRRSGPYRHVLSLHDIKNCFSIQGSWVYYSREIADIQSLSKEKRNSRQLPTHKQLIILSDDVSVFLVPTRIPYDVSKLLQQYTEKNMGKATKVPSY